MCRVRFLNWFIVFFTALLGGCSDLANLGSPSALENISLVIQAETFQRHSWSGMASDGVKLYVLSNARGDTPKLGELLQVLAGSQKQIPAFRAATAECFDDTKVQSGGAAALLLSAWGKWLYGKLTGAIATRLKKFESEVSPPGYNASRLIKSSELDFDNVGCIALHRATKMKPDGRTEKGFVVVIKRDDLGGNALSKFKIVYARLDNSLAVTGVTADGDAEDVTVGIGLTITAARLQTNKPAVVETLTKTAFKELSLSFDKDGDGVPSGCNVEPKPKGNKPKDKKRGAEKRPPREECAWVSDLVPNPARRKTDKKAVKTVNDLTPVYAVEVTVKEVGSAAELAKKAKASFDSLNEGTLQKSFETWLADGIKRAGI